MMQQYTGLEVAVIGMAGRFPGAGNIERFWENLQNGAESIRFFEKGEGMPGDTANGLEEDPAYVRASALLDGKEYFDAAFFNYRPDEAKLMDPQMRIFHECVWEALEDAGCNLRDHKNKIGLFAGAGPNLNWEVYAQLMNREGIVDNLSSFQLSNARFMPTRISYQLNLKGPSLFLDTACSTSLVAIHHAYKSLLLGDCNLALAGGITVSNRAGEGYRYVNGLIYSKDGHCRAFDKDASGTVQSEGAAVVVLKTLKNALKDRDHIWAVIKGSGINNDGNNKVGYTAPSVDGQAEAIMTAHRWSKVSPESISYVEAHGTATVLGDPIEVAALNRAFGKSAEKYCALGSVKTNIGHLDAAAGGAGFIKAVLALKHRKIPPSLHFNSPNPGIDFNESPFYVNTELKEWKNDRYPLRAGVSSFGIGGTNAHVVLEEAPQPEPSSASRDSQLLVFSAATPAALERNMQQFRHYLSTAGDTALPDIAYTLQTGRVALPYRHTLVCRNREEAIAQLASAQAAARPLSARSLPLVVFMFSGQGSQYVNMCRGLYEQEEVFRAQVDQCFDIAERISGRPLRQVVFSNGPQEGPQLIDHTEYTQPLLFIMEYALARLLMKWEIRPGLMIGHSIGEYVAACLSGVFSLEDALYLVIKRGQLMQRAPRGVMLGVSISENELMPLLSERRDIALATVNSSELCVVAGEDDAVSAFRQQIEQQGYKSSLIRTSHAFHSHMMDDILAQFEQEVRKVKISPQQVPFISNLTGALAADAEITDPRYWVDHLRQTVRFSDGLATVLQRNEQAVFIEVGPGKTLGSFVRSNRFREKGHKVVNLTRHAKEPGDDLHYLLSALGNLWQNGIAPAWDQFYEKERRSKLPLPVYSFEKTAYPVNVDAFRMISEITAEQPLTATKDLSTWLYAPTWKLTPWPAINIPAGAAGCTLIFSDDYGVGEALAAACLARNEKAVLVSIGADFEERSQEAYSINPLIEEHYNRLFTSLAAGGLTPAYVIHAWGITEQREEEDLPLAYYRYCTSVLTIAKHLQAGAILEKKITVLTNGLHPVTGKSNSGGLKALSLGLLKVLPQEYPAIAAAHIDISLEEWGDQETIDLLFAEIYAPGTGSVVSLRQSRRWEQVFSPLQAAKAPAEDVFRGQGVYLVTGGLGNFGYTIARSLLKQLQAKVVLLGRTRLPEREAWDALLQSGAADDHTRDRIEKMRLLEEEPGVVLYLQADVADTVSLATAVAIAEEKLGPLNGVIHAAGIISGPGIKLLDALRQQDFQDQFAPKIKGLLVLKEVLAHKTLDFCLLTSSLSALLGGIGFGAYASANTFMDYFVRYHKEQGQLKEWISVNFDGIDYSGDAKMAPINAGDLFQLLRKLLLFRRHPQLAVSVSDLQQRLEKWVYRKNAPELPGAPVALATADNGTDDTAQGLLTLWKDFFGKSDLSPEDDFFEIGGDSLKALTMIGRIHKTLQVPLSIQEFYSNPTIRDLCAHIAARRRDAAGNGAWQPIPAAAVMDHYPASSAQKRLYFLYELDRKSIAYNIPRAIGLQGELDTERFKWALQQLLQRHEMLRTSFLLVNGEPVMHIAEQVPLPLAHISTASENIRELINNNIQPFDLSQAPLLRMLLISDAPGSYVLLLDMHHIITDGVSFAILIKDLMALYNGDALPELKIQYKDYACWLQSSEQQEKLIQQQAFWKNEFAELPPTLDLPADFARPALRTDAGDLVHFDLTQEDTGRLKALAAAENVSLFMVLLAAFNIFLRNLCNEEDIVVGTNTAGRLHPDLERVMGIFVNNVPLRNFPIAELSCREFLKVVQARALAFFENQGYQYEELIDELEIDRDNSRNPLFDILLVYQNFEIPALEIPGLRLVKHSSEQTRSKFDLSLLVTENDNRVHFTFEYATALFKKATIERFAVYFKNILLKMSQDLDKKIADI
jgi:acyl transferase domain-containing protein